MTKILIDEAVVRQALEALEEHGTSYLYHDDAYRKAITALRQALADAALDKMADNARELGLDYEQPAQQEPVAEYIGECSDGSLVQLYDDIKKGAKLYAAPQAQPAGYAKKIESLIAERDALKAKLAEQPAPAQEPLTDEQLEMIWRDGPYDHGTLYDFKLAARAIEAEITKGGAQ